jgi:hypothetical protein
MSPKKATSSIIENPVKVEASPFDEIDSQEKSEMEQHCMQPHYDADDKKYATSSADKP